MELYFKQNLTKLNKLAREKIMGYNWSLNL